VVGHVESAMKKDVLDRPSTGAGGRERWPRRELAMKKNHLGCRREYDEPTAWR